MVRYCSNFKCKLWRPIPAAINDYENKIPLWNRSTRPSIVGVCECLGAASEGDCLRGIYDDKYYCVHPKNMYFAGGPTEILPINQLINCDWYYREL